MLDIHSNVPQSLKNPATNEITHSSGRLWTFKQRKLHTAMTAAAFRRSCLLVYLNLNLKRNGNGIQTPTTPQSPTIITSSRIKDVAPTICVRLPRYIPPLSWKTIAKKTYIHGRMDFGTNSRYIGIENSIGGVWADISRAPPSPR